MKMSKRVRDAVLERDRYRCFICGRSLVGYPCAVHHRKYRSHAPELVNDPANCISVCGCSNVDDCHGKCHNHQSVNPYVYGWSVSGIGTTAVADPHLVPVRRYDGQWYHLRSDGRLVPLWSGISDAQDAALRYAETK